MSSFVLDHQTFDNIAVSIANLSYMNQYGIINEEFGKDLTSVQTKKIAEALYYLNAQGYHSRYGEGFSGYKFSNGKILSPIQLIKSIQCLLYQASEEGPMENNYWYTKLQRVLIGLMKKFIMALPEYDAADWG